jgi:hypothetical protein
VQRRDHFKAVAVFQPQIDHRVGRRFIGDGGEALGNRSGNPDIEATAHHGALEALQERHIVVDQQQAGVIGEKIFNRAHGSDVGVRRPKVKISVTTKSCLRR